MPPPAYYKFKNDTRFPEAAATAATRAALLLLLLPRLAETLPGIPRLAKTAAEAEVGGTLGVASVLLFALHRAEDPPKLFRGDCNDELVLFRGGGEGDPDRLGPAIKSRLSLSNSCLGLKAEEVSNLGFSGIL